MAKRRCKGKTKAGKRCERLGADWCAQHAAQRANSRRTPKKARAREADWRTGFLAAFDEHVSVSEACRVAKVGRTTVYEERARNPSFAAAWVEVEERTTERMEREAYRRGVDGWIEREEFDSVVIDGEVQRMPSLIVRKFSDTLLIFMLKARRPGTYRERVEHTGPAGGPVEHRVALDLSKLTDEQLAALEAIQPDAGSADPD